MKPLMRLDTFSILLLGALGFEMMHSSAQELHARCTHYKLVCNGINA